MSGRAITRRSLLSGAVGALAGAVVRPAGALGGTLAALAGSPRASLEERWLGQLSPGVTTIALAHVADLAGAQWRAPVDARIEMRFRSEGGGWSGWASAGLHGHGLDEPVVGAQAGGYNLVSTGVAVLGTFTSVAPTAAARGALERLLAWRLSLHGLPAEGSVIVRVNPAGASYSRFRANALVRLPRIAGHRDADATECPGNVLYGELPGIRAAVRKLAGHPARATLALAGANPGSPAGQSAPVPSGGEASPAVPTLVGGLETLDGAPIAGASILVQARAVSAKGEVVQERTLAEAVTDAQGSWSLPATFSAARAGRMWLRALYPGSSAAGATISEPLPVQVTASPGAPAEPEPTPPAAAPPAT